MITSEERRKIRKERVLELFKLDPLVPITLKGKEYILEFNNYAVKGVFKDTGLNIMKAGFGQEQMQDPEVMGAMLYWALKTNCTDFTQDDVDKMYSLRHYSYILERLREAIDLFLPDMSDIDAQIEQEKREAGLLEANDGGEGADPLSKTVVNGSATGPQLMD